MIAKGLQEVRSQRGGGNRAKGPREVPTLTGQVAWSPPRSRAQAVTEFARLEHERLRLETELGTRAALQRDLEARLQLVSRRLVMVMQMLNDESVTRAVSAARVNARVYAAPAQQEPDPEPESVYQTISIEY